LQAAGFWISPSLTPSAASQAARTLASIAGSALAGR
jgi:hypothetical protein